MVDGRIDIVINDKISDGPANKLKNIAKSAIDADTALDRLQRSISGLDASPINNITNASARLAAANAKEASALSRLEAAKFKAIAATDRSVISSQKLATELARTEATSARAALTTQRLAAEKIKTAAATAREEAASTRARAALIAEEAAALRLAAAKQRQAKAAELAALATSRSSAAFRSNSKNAQLATHQIQNLIFQVQDIGVSLASGQKPLTVLIQQGTQIAGVFGPGTGLIGILRGLTGATKVMVLAFLPVIAIVGSIAAVIAGLTYEINKTTDVSVGMGDVFKATMILIKDAIFAFVMPAINAIAPIVKKTWEIIIAVTKRLVNETVGLFVFLGDSFKAIWVQFPTVVGDVAISITNNIIGSIEQMVNSAVKLINSLVSAANSVGSTIGISIEEIDQVSFGRIENQFAGAASNLGKTIIDSYNRAFTTDFAGQAFDQIKNKSIEVAKQRIADEAEEEKATKSSSKQLSTKEKILKDILQPLVDYRENIKALNELLNEGAISIGQYNQAVSSLSLVSSLRGVDKSLSLTPFADNAVIEEVRIAEQERLNIVQQALEARIISEQEAADRVVAINEEASRQIQEIETARQSMILTTASDTFASLAEAAKGFAGEQSGIYKALFITSKAFAIADSIIKIQQGIANAMSLPFPANLGAAATVASQAASIVSNIQAVQFADGGKVSGPGGPRDDKILARLSNGEFVVNAAATKRNLGLLQDINNGRDRVRYTPAFRDGGQVQPAFRMPQQVSRVGDKVQPQNNNFNVQVFTRDPDTRVEMTQTQRDTAIARSFNNAQRNL